MLWYQWLFKAIAWNLVKTIWLLCLREKTLSAYLFVVGQRTNMRRAIRFHKISNVLLVFRQIIKLPPSNNCMADGAKLLWHISQNVTAIDRRICHQIHAWSKRAARWAGAHSYGLRSLRRPLGLIRSSCATLNRIREKWSPDLINSAFQKAVIQGKIFHF